MSKLRKTIQQIIVENENYKGEHEAPDKEGSAPIWDLTKNGIYPEDIYSGYATRYYGDGSSFDAETISIIQALKGRKRTAVKIYRAVPNINSEIEKRLKPLFDIINYHNKYGFFPSKNEIIYALGDKYEKEFQEKGYDFRQQQIKLDILQQIESLQNQKQKALKINDGDWVTIVPQYAKEHGQDNLKGNYKILTKTVSASTLFTDGNSIHEWAYIIS